jgi:glycerate kinase
VFGPQKGATARDIPRLERRLAGLDFPAEVAEHPGAGAAGGIGAMLLHMGATLTSGIKLVLELTGWHDQLRDAGLVITGEGTVDHSSLEGKVVSGVAYAAVSAGVPVVVFGGRVVPEAADALRRAGVAAVLPLSGEPRRAANDLRLLGDSLAHLTDIRIGAAA